MTYNYNIIDINEMKIIKIHKVWKDTFIHRDNCSISEVYIVYVIAKKKIPMFLLNLKYSGTIRFPIRSYAIATIYNGIFQGMCDR